MKENMHVLNVKYRSLLADTLTPVNIYLKVRDVFAGSILLESSDYHGQENSMSLVCCHPIAAFRVADREATSTWLGKQVNNVQVQSHDQIVEAWNTFIGTFSIAGEVPQKFQGGMFGYTSYDAVKYAGIPVAEGQGLPDMCYYVYQYVILVDHFSNEMKLINFSPTTTGQEEALDALQQHIFSNRLITYPFKLKGEEAANMDDNAYMAMVEQGKQHCHRGDVFQIVLSRSFNIGFQGDEFNVYRALRSINPSPYLFYFDFGNYKLMGSSPEAQLQVANGEATIFPIAGTFRRTGNDQEDAAIAEKLAADKKENAEHVMLVDLARNDLSRHARKVKVDVFKEIQYYSHVIHLVSKVSGVLDSSSSTMEIAFDTFPAGTLSGAPKHSAMTLIEGIEKDNRGFYGGAIGFAGFDGSYNHAIMIRTFMSRNNTLTYQAGAGVVAGSTPEGECQEVNNKLEALRRAIKLAEKL